MKPAKLPVQLLSLVDAVSRFVARAIAMVLLLALLQMAYAMRHGDWSAPLGLLYHWEGDLNLDEARAPGRLAVSWLLLGSFGLLSSILHRRGLPVLRRWFSPPESAPCRPGVEDQLVASKDAIDEKDEQTTCATK